MRLKHCPKTENGRTCLGCRLGSRPRPWGCLVLAVWAGSRVLLGGSTESSGGPEERAEPPVPVIAPALDPPQAYSLSLAAFQDAGLAARQAEGLAGRRADLLFTTVPVLVSGRVFHRILAGPATDSGAAEELRASLAETLSDEDSALWIVRADTLGVHSGRLRIQGGGGPQSRGGPGGMVGPLRVRGRRLGPSLLPCLCWTRMPTARRRRSFMRNSGRWGKSRWNS